MKRILVGFTTIMFLASAAWALWEPVPEPGDPEVFDGHELFHSGTAHLFSGSFLGRVYSSLDHGETWSPVANVLEGEYAPVVSLLQVGDWLFMSRSFFEVFNHRSRFDGETWSDWEPLGYQDSEFRSITAIGETLFIADVRGDVQKSVDMGLTWQPTTSTGLNRIDLVFAREGRLFASEQEINTGRLYRSDDLGDTWTPLDETPGSSYLCSEIFWRGRLYICVYHMGGIGTFWSSDDFGDSWEQVSTLPTTSNINGMAVADDGRLAIGASGGHPGYASIWLSDDLGDWEDYTHDLPQSSWPFNDLIVHEGWFFKSGGTVTKYRAAQPPNQTAVDDGPIAASAFDLASFPNPFNPKTSFSFNLERAAAARLSVHDSAGRRVAVLVDGILPAGAHEVDWRPEALSTGVYLYRLQVGGAVETGKCVLLQ
ncbi:MAG: T9SS type A sorting domain-containing protein [bacterium]|nr:T9SS type A sorting domain-containing protein [bacterium]